MDLRALKRLGGGQDLRVDTELYASGARWFRGLETRERLEVTDHGVLLEDVAPDVAGMLAEAFFKGMAGSA